MVFWSFYFKIIQIKIYRFLEMGNGKLIKDNSAEDFAPPPRPSPKFGRRYGSTGMDGMSWEENQGRLEVRKHITEGNTRKTTV